MPIEYPIEVKSIKIEENEPFHPKLLLGGHCGDFVKVRPVGDKYEGKTYLGVLIGELPLMVSASWNKEEQCLTVGRYMYNPAIFVPDLKTIIFGAGSWWGRIESPDDLKQITDQDIDNVWYVQALKALDKEES